MLLGKVVGTVWSTRKDEKLVGAKFLIVRQLGVDHKPKDNFVVAVIMAIVDKLDISAND